MKTLAGISTVLLLVVAFSGCTFVVTETKIGEEPADLSAYDLEGVWIAGTDPHEIAMVLEVQDAEMGWLVAGWIEAHNEDLELKKYDIEVREHGDWLVVHFVEEEVSEHPLWFLAKYSSDKIEALVPYTDTFEDLVDAGKIQGQEIEDGLIAIRGLSGKMLEELIAKKELEAFIQEEDFILRRPAFKGSQ